VNNFLLKRSNQAQKFCSNILFISLVRPTEATKMTVTSIYRYKISFHLISCDLLEPAMLWIRYVYPGSESKILHNGSRTRIRIQGKKAPDPGEKSTGSRIRISNSGTQMGDTGNYETYLRKTECGCENTNNYIFEK
jgi:hypothetical protein